MAISVSAWRRRMASEREIAVSSVKASFLCSSASFVELFQRQNVELGFAGGNGVVAAWAVVEKARPPKKVTTAEGGDMPAAARTERRKILTGSRAGSGGSHRPARRVNKLFRRRRKCVFQTRFEVGRGFVLAVLEHLHFVELQRGFGDRRFRSSSPSRRSSTHSMALSSSANWRTLSGFSVTPVCSGGPQVAAIGQAFADVGQNQAGAPRAADASRIKRQQVGGGDIDRLYALEVE